MNKEDEESYRIRLSNLLKELDKKGIHYETIDHPNKALEERISKLEYTVNLLKKNTGYVVV